MGCRLCGLRGRRSAVSAAAPLRLLVWKSRTRSSARRQSAQSVCVLFSALAHSLFTNHKLPEVHGEVFPACELRWWGVAPVGCETMRRNCGLLLHVA